MVQMYQGVGLVTLTPLLLRYIQEYQDSTVMDINQYFAMCFVI
jgi:hypothetical protein